VESARRTPTSRPTGSALRANKTPSKMNFKLAQLTPLALLLYTCGCGPMPVDEKSRRTDPSGKLDAIVVERGTDATVATPTQVFIAPKGQAIPPDTKSKPVLTSDHVKKAEVTWASPHRLHIELKGGRVFRHLQVDEPTGVVVEVSVDGKKHAPEPPASPTPQP
jgi:hypothetical protein